MRLRPSSYVKILATALSLACLTAGLAGCAFFRAKPKPVVPVVAHIRELGQKSPEFPAKHRKRKTGVYFARALHFKLTGVPGGLTALPRSGRSPASIAITEPDQRVLRVLRNRDGKRFGPAQEIKLSSRPGRLIAAALTGATSTDLALAGDLKVLNAQEAKISELHSGYTGLPFGTSSLVSGDFDGDGHADLAGISVGMHLLSIVFGAGDGSFGRQADYPTGPIPAAVAAADFNGDGRCDLAVVNRVANTLRIYLAGEKGVMQPLADRPTGRGADLIQAVDVNGDGKLDLVVSNRIAKSVSVFINDGFGGFAQRVDSKGPVGGFTAFVTGDFSGHGKVDLAGADPGARGVVLLLGDGKGAFTPGKIFKTGKSPAFLSAADLNGDGLSDLIVADTSERKVSLLFGD